jgi:RNA polymerase sigma-70 factor (ECF subfamily)
VTETDDAALIDAIVAHRSERAARTLVDRHSPRLLAVVRRLLANDNTSAEDVLQQAWINGIGALREFRGESAFSTWITRIAIHTALDHLRRRPDLRDSLPDADLAQLASRESDIDGRIDLDRFIAQLPSGCRGVLVLHDIEGFTHEEIAGQFGIAVGTSKAQLFRARRLLRGWLTPPAIKEALP